MGDNCRVLYFAHVPKEEAVVRIGKYCSIAPDCEFFVDGYHRFDHASSFPFYELGLCTTDERNKNGYGKGTPTVGNDVWIGKGVTVMSGVRINHGCVIGARAVVTKTCPPYAIVAGNPGRIIGYRFDSTIRDRLLESEWWDLPYDVVLEYLAPVQHDVNKFLGAIDDVRRRTGSSAPVSRMWNSFRAWLEQRNPFDRPK